MQNLKPFDYGIFIYGAVGTLLALGRVFGSTPKAVLYFWGFFSAAICISSMLALAVNFFIEYFAPAECRIYRYYVCSNIVPTIFLPPSESNGARLIRPPGEGS